MAGIQQAISQVGYNLHLPGLGISEAVGTPYNQYRTPATQYAAQASNPNNQTYGPANPANSGVLGASTGPTSGGGAYGPSQPAGTPQGNPGAGSINANNSNVPQPGQPNIDYSGYDQAIAGLNSYIPALQGQYNTDVGQIQGNQNLATQQANTQTGTESGLLDTSAQQQQNQAGQASTQQRQAASEIQQGLQARYGGTTGTGEFAGELAGRQALTNQANIQQGLQGSLADIAVRKQHVQEVGQQAILSINNQAGTLLNQAKDRLDSQLADIRSQTGQLQAHKSDMAMSALQHYQDTVNQVNAQNAAFRQNIVLQAQQAQSQLAIAQQYAHSYTQGINPQTLPGMQQTPIGGTAPNPPQSGQQASSNQPLTDANTGGQVDLQYLKQLGLAGGENA